MEEVPYVLSLLFVPEKDSRKGAGTGGCEYLLRCLNMEQKDIIWKELEYRLLRVCIRRCCLSHDTFSLQAFRKQMRCIIGRDARSCR